MVLVEDLPGGPVERPDMLFVLLPNGIRTGGEADHRHVPGRFAGVVLYVVMGRCGDEVPNGVLDPFAGNAVCSFHEDLLSFSLLFNHFGSYHVAISFSNF